MSEKIIELKNKQLKQIRRLDRQKIFSANRGWGDQLPIVSIIPSTIQEEDYTSFQQILDSIQDDQLYLVNQEYTNIVNNKWNNETNQQHKQYLLRLQNRLKICNQKWLPEAIKTLQLNLNNRTIMLKQIALYIQNFYQIHQNNFPSLQVLFQQLYHLIMSYRFTSKQPAPLLYSTYIFCKIKWPQDADMNQILNVVNECLKLQDEHIESKAFEILLKVDLSGNLGVQLVKMTNFEKIIHKGLDQNSSFQFVLPTIEMISVLLSGEESVLCELVEKYNIFQRLKPFMVHLLDGIRWKVYWSFSNIAANETHYNLITSILGQLHQFYPKQKNYKIKCEINFIILNWCCNATEKDIAQIPTTEPWLIQFLIETVRENNSIFTQRVMYVIFNFIEKVPKTKILFESLSLLPLLEHIYIVNNQPQLHEQIQRLLQKFKPIHL